MSETEGAILEFEDLLNVRLHGDNIQKYINDWEMTISGLNKVPNEEVLESLFFGQLKKSTQLEGAIALYRQDVTQKGESKSYPKLMNAAKQSKAKQNKANLSKAKQSKTRQVKLGSRVT